jgi:hypothetical protein
MSIDGTVIGVSKGGFSPIYRKQILLAHLPLVLDTRIRRVLNIGLGSASTLEALASHAELEKIDTVEINGSVVRGSRLFSEASALSDPRSQVFVDDVLPSCDGGPSPMISSSPTASRTVISRATGSFFRSSSTRQRCAGSARTGCWSSGFLSPSWIRI